ncbi:MAG: radical SAM family heme chaperone HemW [Chloroflexota bacterium]
MTHPLSIYLHIPFCRHRCAYCDFNTYAGQGAAIPAYVDALVREIGFLGQRTDYRTNQLSNYQTKTIFFGGGTPSLLSPSQFEQILAALTDHFPLDNPETTIEANPGTVSLEYLRDLRSLGVNRISFGVQSSHPDELRMLEREHDFFDVIEAVTWARRAGFDNLSLDLIYGLPEQSLDRWQATVKRAVDLSPEHLSLYALTLEHGTPFGRWSARGLLSSPDPDVAAEMYEWADGFLGQNGFIQYEISNWAKANSEFRIQNSEFECRHNLQYWRNLPYLGLGAGAHGYADGVRYSNVLRIKTYIERLTTYDLPITNYQFPLTPATVNSHKNTPREDMQETMMTGLRLTREGVSDSDFRARYGLSIPEAFPQEVDDLLRLGLVEWAVPETSEVFAKHPRSAAERGKTSEVLRLTPRARLLANQVFMRFV